MDTDAIPYPILSHLTAKLPFAKSNSLIALEHLALEQMTLEHSTLEHLTPEQMTHPPNKNPNNHINKWSWNLPTPTSTSTTSTSTSTTSTTLNQEDPEDQYQEEPFVPRREPETQSNRKKKHIQYDTSWCINYVIELGMILFGFSIAYYLYYYIAVADPPKYTYKTNVSFIDSFLTYLIFPVKQHRTWVSPDGVPPSIIQLGIRPYPALFVLLSALFICVTLLWNKLGIVQMVFNATKFQASPFTHALIAWAWLSGIAATLSLHPSNWVGLFIFISNIFMNLIALIIHICVSHGFAGFAQWGIFGLMAYLFTGFEKYLFTGDPFVTLPKPETPADVDKRWFDTCVQEEIKTIIEKDNANNPAIAITTAAAETAAKLECEKNQRLRPPHKPSILTKLNNSAYAMLPIVRDIILLGFAIIKLVNGISLKTIGGKLFSYGVNITIIVITLASIFMKFPSINIIKNIIWVSPPQPPTQTLTQPPPQPPTRI